MDTLVSQLAKLTNARTVEELWDVHVREMARYGFDRLMYGFTRYRTSSSLGDPQDWVLLSTQSPEYMRVFFDEGLYYHAPMLRWALANDGACSWRWMMDMERVDNITPSERRVMEFNKSMNVTAGYTISFRSISERTKGAIALTAKPGMTVSVCRDACSTMPRCRRVSSLPMASIASAKP